MYVTLLALKSIILYVSQSSDLLKKMVECSCFIFRIELKLKDFGGYAKEKVMPEVS